MLLLVHNALACLLPYFFFLKIIYLFIVRQRGREREREREREALMCGCFSHAPHWGPGRNEPETLWFAGRCSIH